MSRVRPDILHEQCNDDYGLLICHNFDWWQEALNLLVPAPLWQSMLLSKEEARELDDSNKASVPFTFGGEKFELQAYGLRSKEFVLINDDLRLEIGRTDTAMEWTFGWRATAAGLWEHGVHALRKRVYTMCHQAGLRPRFDGQPWVKLSRADYAFDFWAPGFTPEMEPGIADRFVLPPGVKGHGNFYLKAQRRAASRPARNLHYWEEGPTGNPDMTSSRKSVRLPVKNGCSKSGQTMAISLRATRPISGELKCAWPGTGSRSVLTRTLSSS